MRLLFYFLMALTTLPLSSQEVKFKSPSTTKNISRKAMGDKVPPRNYNEPLSAQDMKDIRYVVNTLGTASAVTLAIDKGSITDAGDRIEHVHPLRFLMVIFTDAEMTKNLNSIKVRTLGWVWDRFWKGLEDSLDTEYKRGNITPAMISDFATKVKINPNLITPSINKRQWEQFLDAVVKGVPKSGKANRYKM